MSTSALAPVRTLKQRVENYERRLIMAALAAAGGVQQQTARELGVRPTTLHEKIKRLGIGVVRHVVHLDRLERDTGPRGSVEPPSLG